MIEIVTAIKIMLGLMCGGLLFFALSWTNHRVKTNKEMADIPIGGKLVEVNGHRIHVYAEGEGRETLVFMAGSGTSAPILDFKPLWTALSSDYRIVVVEKAGYGFSDIAKEIPRGIDTILAEYRQALKRAGEMSSRFVLVAHSMSALEAIYWANKYPDEVQAIIGVDPAIPETYKYISIPPLFVLKILSFVASMGVTRFTPLAANSLAIQCGYLSEKERITYKELVYRRTLTANMVEELRVVADNAQTVQALGVPVKTPMYFFISNGREVGVDQWQELLVDYTKKLDNGKYQILDAGHYLHHYEPIIMVDRIKGFLGSL